MRKKNGRNNHKLMGIYAEPEFLSLSRAVAELVGVTRTELFRRLLTESIQGRNAIADDESGTTISQGRKRKIKALCRIYRAKGCEQI
jgi:PAS domain-containing protein